MKVTTDGCLFGGWVADELKKYNEPSRILDIGAGTGLLSLMLAQATETSQIDAVEINSSAYQEAAENFKKSPWKNRLTCHKSAIQNFQTDVKYDLIICNPPFFKGSQQGLSQNKNQAAHSSSLSLEDLTIHIIRLLNPEEKVYLLLPKWEMEQFSLLAEQNSLHPTREVVVRNVVDRPIFRVMKAFSSAQETLKSSTLIIRNKNRKYMSESWELLKDYYLENNNPSCK